MADCIFCKIIEGKIPSTKIYEDENCIVILDLFPVNRGHTLVIPKRHYETLLDAPEELCFALLGPIRKVAGAIVKTTNSDGFNLVQNNKQAAGQLVPHLHFHIIPRKIDDGLKFQWRQLKYAEGEMAKMAESIRRAMN